MSLPDDAGSPPSPELDEQDRGMPPEVPAVVVVVVAHNPGRFLEAALGALGAQDYPAVSVLVVDAGSASDPTGRVAATLPAAFVHRTRDAQPGFGGAANEALEVVEGATFFLVCHDDVVLAPDAVRLLVEEAYRSNAAIVGPKLVSAENPEVLLEVGRSIDRLGGSHTGIEPGELDQEQHDAVRDVFYVSSAAMLVRADLFETLGGFDAATFPGSEDLDLCWRARLAGARVVVAPDARAAHVEAVDARRPEDVPSARDVARRRVRVLLTCYSWPSLLRVVPLGVALAAVEALVFAATPRRRQAAAVLGAWRWTLFHPGAIRSARRRAQAGRTIDDRELRELQVGARTRVGAFLAQHRADERIESLEDAVRDRVESLGRALVHPAALALLAFLVTAAVGSRDFFSSGVPAVGSFASWPGVHALAAAFTSPWRYTGLGSTAPAPPVLAVMAGLGTLFVGSVGTAEAVLVTLAIPVGALGALRLSRHVGVDGVGSIVAAVAYGVSPVPRNAIAGGRLGPLVLFALLPYLVLLLVRAARFEAVPRGRRQLLGLALVTGIACAWFPPAALVVLAAALALGVAALVVGGVGPALRSVGAAAVGAIGAGVLLFPWSTTVTHGRRDPAAFGFSLNPSVDLADLVRFHTGPAGSGIATFGLLAAAGLALLLTTGPRVRWAARAWALILVAWAAVELPARFAPGVAVPAPEAVLSLGALGVALAAGLAVASRPRGRLALRTVGVAVALAGVTLGGLGFVADAVDGRWHAPSGSWPAQLAFTRDQQFQGQFRVLWVGDPAALPLDPARVESGLSYTLTRNGPGDARELLRAPRVHARDPVVDAVTAAVAGRTTRLGRIVAPLGVRYVVLPRRNGPGGAAARPLPALDVALRNQLDLARLGSDPGLELYENQAWFPGRTIVRGRRAAVPARPADPLRAAAGTDLTGSPPLGAGPAGPGTVLWFEAYDAGWRADAHGTLVHQPAFGTTNQFRAPSRASVSISHTGQARTDALVAAEVALWLLALAWWARGRARPTRATDRAAARAAARATREERRRDRGGDFGSDVEFWERA
ncbi:MAG TPA: glycosyltransferase [Acidimicrobiia bacterium]|jgi:GT2 family glycosyltransferase|nr:glycosyltransferase [Acidimicrobiia bacterium]